MSAGECWIRRDRGDGSESSELVARVRRLCTEEGLSYDQVRKAGRFETAFAIYYIAHGRVTS